MVDTKPKTNGKTAARKSTGRAAKAKAKAYSLSEDENESSEQAASSDYEDDNHDSDPAPKRPSKRGQTGKGRVVESDNEDSAASSEMELDSEDEEVIAVSKKRASTKKTNGKGAKKAGKVKFVSDDEEESNEEDEEESEEEDEKPKTGGKRKSISKKPSKGEPAAKKAKVVKEKKEKKDERRVEKKLSSAAVQKDWTKMPAPLFEMFKYNRIVLDEYTYVDGKTLTMVTNLSANHRWVLSGTPPIHDFAAVRSIAAHLGIHLGVDDIGESLHNRKKLMQQTGASNHLSVRRPMLKRRLQMSRSSMRSARSGHSTGTRIASPSHSDSSTSLFAKYVLSATRRCFPLIRLFLRT